MKNIPNIKFNSKENKTEFEILNLKELFNRIFTDLDHNPSLPHRISFFALLIVTKGTGTHKVDLQEYDLQEGTVLKIAKGQVHNFQKNPNYHGFLILFTESFVLNYFSKSSINLISHLYNYHVSNPIAQDKKGNQTFLKELYQELESENTFAEKNIIAALLDVFLLRLERTNNINKPLQNNTKHYATFLKFKNLVERNYTKTRNVKDYADLLFISTKSLNTIVKEFTLNTAKNFIDNYVILESQRSIVSSNKSLKEIAFDIGFDEVTNFTKFFKNKMKISPKHFRLNQQ